MVLPDPDNTEVFEFPNQAMIDSWNGAIYALAGVETNKE